MAIKETYNTMVINPVGIVEYNIMGSLLDSPLRAFITESYNISKLSNPLMFRTGKARIQNLFQHKFSYIDQVGVHGRV